MQYIKLDFLFSFLDSSVETIGKHFCSEFSLTLFPFSMLIESFFRLFVKLLGKVIFVS